MIDICMDDVVQSLLLFPAGVVSEPSGSESVRDSGLSRAQLIYISALSPKGRDPRGVVG